MTGLPTNATWPPFSTTHFPDRDMTSRTKMEESKISGTESKTNN